MHWSGSDGDFVHYCSDCDFVHCCTGLVMILCSDFNSLILFHRSDYVLSALNDYVF